MNGVNIKLTDEQIRDAVRAVVEEEMPEAVRDEVRKHADAVIKERVGERIGAVVDEMLANEQFVTARRFGGEAKLDLDATIKRAVSAYLDETVYLYSKTDERPSVRFNQCSGNGPSRLEAFLRFSIERFCDEHLANKLQPIVASFIEQKGGIEQVARQEMAAILKEKFKL